MGYIPRVGDISVEVHSKTKDPFWMIARRDKDGEWYLIRMALAFSDVQRYTDNMVQVGEERNQRIGETSGKCPECSTVFALKPARLP